MTGHGDPGGTRGVRRKGQGSSSTIDEEVSCAKLDV